MTKFAHADVQDAYGAAIAAQCIRIAVCSAFPATYAEIATYRLAEFTVTSGDFTAGAGVTGRKLTVAAQTTPVNATASDPTGTTQHIVLHDNSAKRLFVQPPSNPQPITSGNPVTLGAFDITLPTPT